MRSNCISSSSIDILIVQRATRRCCETPLGFAKREALGQLRHDGSTAAVRSRMLTSEEYNDCLGLLDVEHWEARFPD